MKYALPILALAAFGTLTATEPLKMNPVPIETLDYATNTIDGQIRFRHDLSGGAHTHAAHIIGRTLVQALASYLGNPRDDADYVQRIRFLLEGPNSISGEGGYTAQHEHVLLSSLIVARETPSIWKQFSDEEKKKIDLRFKAHFAGCAFTTSDKADERGAPVTLNGSRNLSRQWNPNFREGMIGGLILGACWLGPKEAQAFLDNFDHAKFVEELKTAGLTNTHEIHNWKAIYPDSEAPMPEEINESLRGFRYFGKDVTNPMELYIGLAEFTYGAKVNAGLNGGAGKDGGGKLVKNTDKLPNVDKKGMLLEFDAMDGLGPRSCAVYSYHGMRPNLAKQIALLVSGHFDYNHPRWKEIFEQLKVGNEDLFFKLENGYISYSKGRNWENDVNFEEQDDKRVVRDLWNTVLLPYHTSQTK